MEHLSDERLHNHVWEDDPLMPGEIEHLAGCTRCRVALDDLIVLAEELAVARLSRPEIAALERYRRLFRHVQRAASDSWLESVRMALSLDSRRQGAALGVRQAATRSYRLLFSAEPAEVEVMVESRGQGRRLVGEILVVDESRFHLPALVQLQAHGIDREIHAAESDGQGRFHLENVAPGEYDLVFTPAGGPLLTIEGAAIA